MAPPRRRPISAKGAGGVLRLLHLSCMEGPRMNLRSTLTNIPGLIVVATIAAAAALSSPVSTQGRGQPSTATTPLTAPAPAPAEVLVKYPDSPNPGIPQ